MNDRLPFGSPFSSSTASSRFRRLLVLTVAVAALLLLAVGSGSAHSLTAVDGNDSDWLAGFGAAGCPSLPAANSASLYSTSSGCTLSGGAKGTEYIWTDTLGDQRTDHWSGTGNLDLTQFRMTATETHLNFLLRFSDITNCNAQYIAIAINSGAGGTNFFPDNAETGLPFDYERVVEVNTNATGYWTNNTTFTSAGSSFCNDTANLWEIQMPLSGLGLTYPFASGQYDFAAAIFCRDTGGTICEAGGSDAMDAITTVGGNTFNEVGDGTLNYSFTTALNDPVDVQITKSGPTSADLGAQVEYTLTFVNNGPGTATGVVVTDAIPSQLTNVSYTVFSQSDPATTVTVRPSTQYIWDVSNLGMGDSVTIKVTGTLDPNAALTSFDNTATIATTADDTSAGNSSTTTLTPTEPAQPGPTFTVNSTADTNDGRCGQRHCTLREAITAANARTNTDNGGTAAVDPDQIHFDIPSSGVQTIAPGSSLPSVTGTVVIDGTTQTGASCAPWPATLLVQLSGSSLASGNLLNLSASNSTVRGLVLNGTTNGTALAVTGSNNRVECNFIGTNAAGTSALPNFTGVTISSGASNNIIGTNGDDVGDGAERNLISGNASFGVRIIGTGTSSNRVAGNTIGTNAAGTSALPNFTGVRIDNSASSNIIGTNGDGNADAAEGNLISGNIQVGVQISDAGTSSNRVAGNYIGTNAAGTSALPSSTGVSIESSASSNIIGTNGDGMADAAERNLISGNIVNGILIVGAGTNDNWVAGNYIGTNAAGTSALPNGTGIGIQSGASDNLVGGDLAVEQNIIALNRGDGIAIAAGTGNRIQRDSIHDNGQQGIDLGNNGATANDTSDPDTGPNNYQNYPTFTALINLSGQLVVHYTVDSSTSNSTYPLTVEFFEADSAVSREGETFLGDNSYNSTPGTQKSATLGNAATLGLAQGDPLVATATDANGNTSEFSLPVAVDVEQPGPTFTVNSADDTDDGYCTEQHCTLSEAITAANARTNTDNNSDTVVDPDQIHFDIPGTGVQTITPGSTLPSLTGAVVIDGTTQTDASCAAWPPTLQVELSGSNIGSSDLLTIASNSTVRGLVLNRANVALEVTGSNNRVECNFVGTDAAGDSALPNSTGVLVVSGASNNLIGTNLISGNGNYGVRITGTDSDDNWLAGNTIGTNITGTTALPNVTGVFIDDGASSNIIGTDGDGTADAAEGNLISGNGNGVMISGTGSNTNRVAGNTIGTDAAGTSALPNSVGVLVEGSASGNIIGTNSSDTDPAQTGDEAEGNLISGNTTEGVWLIDSDNNRVAGNRIGTNADGTGALPNAYGVLIQGGASSNIIGTDGDGTADEAERNLISGNTEGVWITGSSSDDNRVAGNYIGTNAAGTSALPNNTGVLVELGASDTIIRTNLISGNANYGVLITGTDTDDNWLAGNTIGTNAAGTSALPNITGVVIQNGASNNLVGTNSDGTADEAEDNLISGNSDTGISIAGSDTNNNRVAGNSIGTNAAGTSALANVTGVYVGSDANSNIIGTNGDGTGDNGEGNLISGNTDGGIHLSGTISTTVAGNVVGLDVTGAVLSNTVGILVNDTMSSTIGTNGDGTSDEFEGNVISGNGSYGVQLTGGSEGNTIAGNLIGVVQATVTPAFRARGSLNAGSPSAVTPADYDPRGNGGDGIFLSAEGDPSTNNLIGGNLPVEQNVIAYNGSDGVAIVDGTGNRVQRNAMFDNSEEGIDLGDDGPTPNDPGDLDGSLPPAALRGMDSAPNNYQNYPTMITAIISSSGELVVTYLVDSIGPPFPFPASVYPLTIEFFEADSALSGEGRTFLAQDSYTETLSAEKTVTLGNAAALGVAGGDPLVGTATDAEGNTSEFSVPVAVAAPTAMQLAGLTATQEGAQVLLQWETVSEQGNAGFHLYRSTSPDSEGERLNAALIASEAPNSSEGFAYQWVDTDVEVGTTYYYWLEAVSTSGTTSRFGPASVEVNTPTALALDTFVAGRGAGRETSALAALALAALVGFTIRRRRRAA